jgi:UDP-N-acetylglucosamine 2-epimerase (non-hydrolysing)
MKAAPIHAEAVKRGLDHQIIHTGQHYDEVMSKVFFEDLGMPKPSVYLGVGSGSHATQTAKVMIGLEKVFLDEKPDLINVVGDVNSTMAAALVATKLHIPVVHTEAGLRSRDWNMPEEINRVVTDAICDLLLTPSTDGDDNLLAEGKPADRIVCVGNVMIDTLFTNLERARQLDLLPKFGLEEKNYAVLTMHRPSNVDVEDAFTRITDALLDVAKDIPIVFPIHPRTAKNMEKFGLKSRYENAKNIKMITPLGYLEFMALVCHCKFVLTDSGGLQEETTALGLPCITMRENTERPITVDEGTNIIVGTDGDKIRRECAAILAGKGKSGRVPKLWDGRASARIVDAFMRLLDQRSKT